MPCLLTDLYLDKINTILQRIFSDAFLSMEKISLKCDPESPIDNNPV